MGLAKCKKQSLIETHSENLINQLRYHIVQAETPEASGAKFILLIKTKANLLAFSCSDFASRQYFKLPDGFFDETMLQEDKITSASLKKRQVDSMVNILIDPIIVMTPAEQETREGVEQWLLLLQI